MKNKVLLLIIISIYILLPILILLFPLLYNIKFYLLTIFGILIYLLMRLSKISNTNLGIKKESLLISIKRNIPLIILFIVIIVIYTLYFNRRFIPDENIYFYLFYIFISCPIQEFLYRGTFGYFEKIFKNRYLWVIISSLCYSFVHIIYRDLLTCILTFAMGIIWYILYRKDYNLTGVVLSHIVLGILTISLGIIN